MIPRNALRLGFLRNQIRRLQTEALEAVATEEVPVTTEEVPISSAEEAPIPPPEIKPATRGPKKIKNPKRFKPGEGDPKLAQGIVDLLEGPGAVKIPKSIIGLHLDFAKASFNGHRGARKFAMSNLPRMKFYNPHLDIKVFRRPWAGQKVQLKYPCTATILKYDGRTEKVEMQWREPTEIAERVLKALQAEKIDEQFEITARQKAEVKTQPHLKWI